MKLYRSPSMLGRLLYRSGDFLKPILRASGHWGKPRLASRAAQPCTACIPARGLRPSEDKWLGQHGKAPCCNSTASLSRHSCPTSAAHLLLLILSRPHAHPPCSYVQAGEHCTAHLCALYIKGVHHYWDAQDVLNSGLAKPALALSW